MVAIPKGEPKLFCSWAFILPDDSKTFEETSRGFQSPEILSIVLILVHNRRAGALGHTPAFSHVCNFALPTVIDFATPIAGPPRHAEKRMSAPSIDCSSVRKLYG